MLLLKKHSMKASFVRAQSNALHPYHYDYDYANEFSHNIGPSEALKQELRICYNVCLNKLKNVRTQSKT